MHVCIQYMHVCEQCVPAIGPGGDRPRRGDDDVFSLPAWYVRSLLDHLLLVLVRRRVRVLRPGPRGQQQAGRVAATRTYEYDYTLHA
jgi:hypothetical protein